MNDTKEIRSQQQIIENIILGETKKIEENMELAPEGKGSDAAKKLYKKKNKTTAYEEAELDETDLSPEKQEEVVLEFLKSTIGSVLTEGTEEDKEKAIIEAVTNLNLVTEVLAGA